MRYLGVVVVLLVLSGQALAEVSHAQRAEVAHLLDFIRSSTCTIERNGSPHSGQEAYSHVKKKYDHYRDDIKTTEDFIAYSATKSMLSGRYYTVTCSSMSPIRTKDWLLSELARIRG